MARNSAFFAALAQGSEYEVIIVEAGSELPDVAQATVLASPQKNRAFQMNLGAAQAAGELLVFLHADTVVAPASLLPLYRLLKNDPEFVGGAFRFALNSSCWKARVIEWGVWLRERVFGLPYGDQALFVWKAVFEDLGAYPEVVCLEDVLLVQALKKRGKLFYYKEPARTDARKWEQRGYLKNTLMNWGTILRYAVGRSGVLAANK